MLVTWCGIRGNRGEKVLYFGCGIGLWVAMYLFGHKNNADSVIRVLICHPQRGCGHNDRVCNVKRLLCMCVCVCVCVCVNVGVDCID